MRFCFSKEGLAHHIFMIVLRTFFNYYSDEIVHWNEMEKHGNLISFFFYSFQSVLDIRL